MGRLMDSIIIDEFELVLEKEDVMTVLEVLDGVKRNSKFHKCSRMEIGKCGWSDRPNKWAIVFEATANQWDLVVDHLDVKGYDIVIKDDGWYLNRRKEEA